MVARAFSSVTAVRAVEDGADDDRGDDTDDHATVRPRRRRYTTDIDPAWTIAGRPNGGYLLAVLARAALATHGSAGQPHVLAASAHYLTAPKPGPAQVSVELLRAGRSASQLRGTLRQDGESCVEALFTLGTLELRDGPRWAGGVPELPAGTDSGGFAAAWRLTSDTPSGMPVPIMDEVDLRLDGQPADGQYRPTGRGALTGWLALPGEDFDPVSLLYALDAFPPATYDLAPSGWVPTLALSCYVRALPAPGPVRVLHRANLLQNDRVDEQTWVWDGAGRPVASATQLAGIRFG